MNEWLALWVVEYNKKFKLGNSKKVPEINGTDSEYPAGYQKHSIEKPILPNFVNLSTIFCPRLSEKTYFHF